MRRLMTVLTLPAMALAMLTGCSHQTYSENQKVDTTPLVIDQAMQQRQWDPVIAHYENGETKSGSTGFAYVPNHGSQPYTYFATDTFTFVLNVVTLPYTYYQQWDGVTSGGVKLSPTYTAVPPMPPSTQPTE